VSLGRSPTFTGLKHLAALLAILLVSRLPALLYGVVNIDESDFVLMGRVLGRGDLPYVDLIEKKPLLVYAFYLPAAWFDFEMWPMQLMMIVWTLLTAWVVGRATREWTGRKDAAFAAALLAALAIAASVPSVNTEDMLNLPAALALLSWIRAEKTPTARSELAFGAWAGVASLFKQQAGILLVARAVHLAVRGARHGQTRERIAAIITALFAFSAPWTLAVAWYLARGHIAEFMDWNLLRNFHYTGSVAGSSAWRLLGGLILGVLFGAPLAWTLAIRDLVKRSERDPVRDGLGLALALTWIPVSLGGRFYDHYFIQFAPIVALLGGPPLADLWAAERRRARTLIAAALAIPLLFWVGFNWSRGPLREWASQEPRAAAIASWLRENTAPSDRVFVWGHYTPIYTLSGREPGSRYPSAAVHVGDFDPGQVPIGFDARTHVSTRDVEATIDDLEKNRTPIVVDTAPAGLHDWDRFPLSIVPTLEAYIEHHYRRLPDMPGGAHVYRRL
jgi:hypothetical protein